ncbi:Hypothetical protein CpPAT10_0208 [Corynebacterium pseudotuberculosis PAT10]|nr:Hypothetical protein CpPAT10_0208 [Corynebacterium pseudotuberculosis PAT10]
MARFLCTRRRTLRGVRGRPAYCVCSAGRCESLASISPYRGFAVAGTVIDMTKWEYATVPLLTHATKQILDTWGEDGWELVNVVPGPNPENVVAYMKREVE